MQSHEIKNQGSTVCCPRCSHAIGGSRFATHLEKCMIGGKRGSRKHYDALDDNFFFHGRGSKVKADPHPDSLIIKIKLRKGGKENTHTRFSKNTLGQMNYFFSSMG